MSTARTSKLNFCSSNSTESQERSLTANQSDLCLRQQRTNEIQNSVLQPFIICLSHYDSL